MMSDSVDEPELNQRLSRISTRWNVVLEGHFGSIDGSAGARNTMVELYFSPIYRYLLGAVRDADAAEELSHEFAVRCLRGDFHRADPRKGRFRDYVKTVLINLVNDHFRSRQQAPRQFASQADQPAVLPQSGDAEPSFEDCLRDEILDRTWLALEKGNPRYYRVLKFRVENPDLSSREMAHQLSSGCDAPMSASGVRKTLERARTQYAHLLLDVASETLECSLTDTLRTELQELRLLEYCRSALDRQS